MKLQFGSWANQNFLLAEKRLTEIYSSVRVWNFLEPKNRLTDFGLTETSVSLFCTPLIKSKVHRNMCNTPNPNHLINLS